MSIRCQWPAPVNEGELARIDRELAEMRAAAAALGDKCPAWLAAMGEAEWIAERSFLERASVEDEERMPPA